MSKQASVRCKTPTEAANVNVKMIIKGIATPTKKVLIPNSLALLKKTCDQMFKPEKPIQSFKTEDGTPITNIKEIIPGSTIVASIRASKPKQEPESTISFKDIERVKFIGGVPSMSATTSMMSVSRQGERPGKTVTFDMDQRSVAMSTQQRHQLTLGDNASVFSRAKSVQSSQMNDQSMFDESQMGRSTISKRRCNVEQTNIKQMMNTLIEEERSLGALDYLIRTSDNEETISSLIPLEDLQCRAWINALTSQTVLSRILNGIDVYGETKDYAASIIEDHRFISGKWVSHYCKMAVVGPAKSGKSVLLAELATQLFGEMAYTGEWKSTMAFSFDFLEIASLMSTYELFLGYMVDASIYQIIAQKPHLSKKMNGLAKKLKGITEMDPHIPTKSEQTAFDEIIINLRGSWSDPNGMEQFILNVVMLPLELSKAVGIDNVVMIIDNFEECDEQIIPYEPFTDSGSYVFIIEAFKYMISNTNFIIACKNTHKFMNILKVTDNGGIELAHDLDIISTMDVAEVDDQDLRTKYMVHVEGEQLGLPLNIRLCGGVVHYQHMWDNLTGKIDHWMESGAEKNDEFLEVIIAAHEVINLVYQSEEDEEIRVTNVVRVQRPEPETF